MYKEIMTNNIDKINTLRIVKPSFESLYVLIKIASIKKNMN